MSANIIIPNSTTCNIPNSNLSPDILYNPLWNTTDLGFYLNGGVIDSFELIMQTDKLYIISSIKIGSAYISGYEAIKDFQLYGITPTGKEILLLDSSLESDQLFELKEYNVEVIRGFNIFKFKCLNCHPGNGGNEINLGRLLLYGIEGARVGTISEVSHKNASHLATLPMNTTANILKKYNDFRTGLLGMANDGENFGTLYVINKTGRAQLIQTKMKTDVLFEGIAKGLNDRYTLGHDIRNYRYIEVFASITTNSQVSKISNTIDVSNIAHTDNEFLFNFTIDGTTRSINIKLNDDNISFTITSLELGGAESIQICKVIGVY